MSIPETKLFPKIPDNNNGIFGDNNEFKISNDTRNSLSEDKKKEFRRIYKNVMFFIKGDFFYHPRMEDAIKLITPEGKNGKAIRDERATTIAHNAAWVGVGL